MEASFVKKKAAKYNENIEVGETTTLHSSRNTNITLTPFFIKHSDSSAERDLSIKLTRREISKSLTKDCTINLQKDATILLRDKLNELLELKKVPDNGNFIIINLGDKKPIDLSGKNSSEVAEALISILENKEIRSQIGTLDFSEDLSFAFRHSIHIKSLERAMSELEIALNTIDEEQYYQEWCEKNGWIFGNQYIMNDTVRGITANDRVDFLATSVLSGFRDIIELKKPSFSVLNEDGSHSSFYFSSEVSKAIGQCHRYLDNFSEYASKGLVDHAEIVAYHPRATIIIGRSNDWSEEKHKALHGLNSRLNGISVLTYDHLLKQGKRLIDILKNSPSEEVVDEIPLTDDDLPL